MLKPLDALDLSELYRRYNSTLVADARRLGAGPDAEDIVQDVWLSGHLPTSAPPLAFLRILLRQECARHHHRARRCVPMEMLADRGDPTPIVIASPELATAARDRLAQCVMRLTCKQARALQWHYLEGRQFTNDQRVAAQRAVRSLRTCFASKGQLAA